MRFDPIAADFARADRALLVLSDVEIGAGGVTDDLPDAPWFEDLLGSYCEGPWAALPLDLVFNGDTFDLLKTPIGGAYVHLVDAAGAIAKVRSVAAAHPLFFRALRSFLAHPRADRRIWFVVGNHDFELLFPEVQAELRALLHGTEETVRFPGFEVDIGDVHLEHGSQADPLFRIDPAHPFVDWQGVPILNLPWASVALVDVAMPIHSLLYPADRARPADRVLTLLPEIRSLVLDRYWRYWTRDWLGAWWQASDPMKRVSWTMFRQVAWRLQSGDPSIVLDRDLAAGFVRPGRSLVLVGHLHEPGIQAVGGTRLLRTGCLRDEFVLDEAGSVVEVRPKAYAEVLLRRDRVFRSRLVEIPAVEGATAAMPSSILDLRAALAELRSGVPETSGEQRQQLEVDSKTEEAEAAAGPA